MTLGQRIQELRRAHDLSQEALGEKLGVSRQAVSRWEMDGAVPEVDKLIAMGRLFGVSLNDLLGIEDPEQAPKRRRPRLLPLLCGVLALALVISSGLAVHFYRQLDTLLNPPVLPLAPVSQSEYAYEADYDTGLFQLAMALTSDELDGWEVTATLSIYDPEQGRSLPVREQALQFQDGSATLRFEDVPFEPYHDITVQISYIHGLLEGRQQLLIIHPKGKYQPMWEVELPRQSGPEGYQVAEAPALLTGT